MRLLRIISEEGLVRHLHTDQRDRDDGGQKGRGLLRLPCARTSHFLACPPRKRSRVFFEPDGHRTLAIILPIENSTDCSSAACHAHPPQRQILGVIDAHLSLESVDAQLAEHRTQMMAFTIAAALIVSLLSAVFIFVFVHRPVRELIYGTLKIGRGDLKHRIHVGSSDEFGLLAAAFNRMAGELGQAYGELQEWARRLEDRVHEKTAELEQSGTRA